MRGASCAQRNDSHFYERTDSTEDWILLLFEFCLPPDDSWSVVTDVSASDAASLRSVGQISPHSWEEGRGRPAVRLALLQELFARLD